MIPTASAVSDVPCNGTTAPASKSIILEETARLCAQVYKNRLRALVLTGSVARDEGTFVETADGVTLLGDAEFFAVFHDASAIPAATDLRIIEDKVRERLRRRGLVANVSISGVQRRYFRGVRPSIFGYELRTCGLVAWGDEDILRLIPPFGVTDIPLEDGWRLLANRLVEQLEGFEDLASGRPTISAETYYRTVKLYLDMGTSLLLFVGGYAPTYAQRAEALANLPAGVAEALPFPLEPFVRDVVAATRWKLATAGPDLAVSRDVWQRAIDHAERLWCWELSRLTGRTLDDGMPDLLRAWMRRQPLTARLRGWAHVARREGLRGSFARWPRWLCSAMSGSPRYLVYSVAAPMVFALRQAAGKDRPTQLGNAWPGLPDRLPEWSGGRGRLDARQAVNDVLENYRDFLVGTRS